MHIHSWRVAVWWLLHSKLPRVAMLLATVQLVAQETLAKSKPAIVGSGKAITAAQWLLECRSLPANPMAGMWQSPALSPAGVARYKLG